MEEFRESCANARDFPENLIRQLDHRHVLRDYHIKLGVERQRLFCAPSDASLHVWYAREWGGSE